MYRDKVDEKIIEYLKENARESFVDIGKKLKLSESAVRRRVKNLQGSGTIKKFTLELGDSIIIEKNQIHSLENVESSPLEIVEIQTGDYLGEDDIVRLEDIYGRSDLH